MGSRVVASVLVVALAPWPAAGQEATPLKVSHKAPLCWEPAKFPEVRARIEPITMVVRARVLFRTDQQAEPHAVEMKQEGEEFVAVLPKPTGNPSQAFYRIEATDPNVAVTRSDEAIVLITTCSDAAPTRGRAHVEVAAPAGAPPVPPGFGDDRVAAEGTPEEHHPGVFNLGEGGSLAAALGVFAVAGGIGLLTNNEKVPPARDPDFEPPGVTLIDATPASGSSTRLDGVRITVRMVAAETAFGMPKLELRQAAGGPVCAESPLRGNIGLSANIGQNVSFQMLMSTGACGTSFEANSIRLSLADIRGFAVPNSPVPETELPLRYVIAP